jgi:hypothetical protein
MTYAPTANPGDTRRRAREILLTNPLAGDYRVRVTEQDVIRTEAGDIPLTDVPTIVASVSAADLDTVLPLRDVETDALLGGATTVGAVLAGIYAYVRALQIARDAAALAPPADPDPPAPGITEPEPAQDAQ